MWALAVILLFGLFVWAVCAAGGRADDVAEQIGRGFTEW